MAMHFRFEPLSLPREAELLRQEVRKFLAEALGETPAYSKASTWVGFDAKFSQCIGARGWIGMTWPKKYGGGERSALERYVMLEEMLAAGAPVAAHWFADRQSGPLLLRYGSEEQRRELLPRIARGELYFAVGMSEPNVGSDVASVRTRAKPIDGGWMLNGTKVWSTYAHRSHYMIALVRTSGETEDRHAGLSQVLIDLSAAGVTIRPIKDITGGEHFNEVVFEDVRLPQSAVIGKEGDGWNQVMAELAYERSGPERYLSSLQSLIQMIAAANEGRNGERLRVAIGRGVAHVAVLRQMSLSIASQLQAGHAPNLEAALVKDLGTSFEQSLPETLHEVLGFEPMPLGSEAERVHALLLQLAPCFSLRGGTREILRGIIARGLGLR
jgi:alkylation response protein AidB-like acyl-CoA dehydrogenase